jgi:DNA-binding protein HU-beta
MNKSDIISKMATDAGITKAQAQAALKSILDASKQALKNGDKFTLQGFGTFYVSERRARKGRNPQTGKEINIGAKKVGRFRAGPALKNGMW